MIRARTALSLAAAVTLAVAALVACSGADPARADNYTVTGTVTATTEHSITIRVDQVLAARDDAKAFLATGQEVRMFDECTSDDGHDPRAAVYVAPSTGGTLVAGGQADATVFSKQIRTGSIPVGTQVLALGRVKSGCGDGTDDRVTFEQVIELSILSR